MTNDTGPGVDQQTSIFWSPFKRFGFRFLAVYFVLYAVPFPLNQLPWLGSKLSGWIDAFWKAVGPWVGTHVLRLEGEMFVGPTGSGDTTLDYVKLLIMVVAALLGAVVWTVLARGRTHHDRAARWLTLGTRYYLATVVLSYGLVKVIPTQFIVPGPGRLLRTFGDASPMGIVWTFMGMSPAYTIFSGLAEASAGVLLVFRRTRTLGALVAAAVMTNVAALNYFYDVPVKLFSSHLLLMAIALALLDSRRLLRFFLGTGTVEPPPDRYVMPSRSGRLVGAVIAMLLVGSVAWDALSQAWETHHVFGNARPKPAIWGVHEVETFLRDGEEVPPLMTDETRWRALLVDRAFPMAIEDFSRPGSISIQALDGTVSRRTVHLDEETATLTILPAGQRSFEAAAEAGVAVEDILRYEIPEPGRLVVRGRWGGARIEVTMKTRGLDDFELTGRGFHWINEYPRNR